MTRTNYIQLRGFLAYLLQKAFIVCESLLTLIVMNSLLIDLLLLERNRIFFIFSLSFEYCNRWL